MTEALINGYSSESTQRELANEYKHYRVLLFQNSLRHCVLYGSSLGIGTEVLSNSYEYIYGVNIWLPGAFTKHILTLSSRSFTIINHS